MIGEWTGEGRQLDGLSCPCLDGRVWSRCWTTVARTVDTIARPSLLCAHHSGSANENWRPHRIRLVATSGLSSGTSLSRPVCDETPYPNVNTNNLTVSTHPHNTPTAIPETHDICAEGKTDYNYHLPEWRGRDVRTTLRHVPHFALALASRRWPCMNCNLTELVVTELDVTELNWTYRRTALPGTPMDQRAPGRAITAIVAGALTCRWRACPIETD